MLIIQKMLIFGYMIFRVNTQDLVLDKQYEKNFNF